MHQNVKYGTSLPLTIPVREGYTFTGWAKDEAGTVSFPLITTDTSGNTVETTMPRENLVLYAQWSKNSYKLNFITEGGTTISSKTIEYNTSMASSMPANNPTKEGYAFAGWYTDAQYTSSFNANCTMPNHDVNIYARWDITITLDFVGGSIPGFNGDTITVPYGTRPAKPTDSKRYNTAAQAYDTFCGWYLEDDTAFDWTALNTRTTHFTLKAKWSAAPITITFKISDTSTRTVKIDSGSTVAPIANPSLSGYTFGGWIQSFGVFYVTAEQLSTITYFDFTTKITTPTTLSAVWIQQMNTVTLNCMDGSIDQAKLEAGHYAVVNGRYVLSYYAGTKFTLPEPTQKGYEFLGWTTSYNDNNLQKNVSFTMPNNNYSMYYAKWGLASATVHFVTNGGSSIADYTGYVGDKLRCNLYSYRAGYEMDGWYWDAAFTNPVGDTRTVPESNATMYLKWRDVRQTVTFDSQDGSSVAPITGTYGDTISMPANPTRANYIFKGWYKSADFTGSPVTLTTMPKSTTLYALWYHTSVYIILMNDGTEHQRFKVNPGELPGRNYTAPTKIGSTLEGWYTDNGTFKNKFSWTVTIDRNQSTDIILYAKWTEQKFTVRLKSNDGSMMGYKNFIVDQSTKFVTVQKTDIPDPTRQGYNFAGWYTDRALTSAASFPITITESTIGSAAYDLFAKWKLEKYTLSFVTNGGAAIASVKVNRGDSIDSHLPAYASCIKDGCWLYGWYTDPSLTTVLGDNIPMTGDCTLYASWRGNLYTINFDVSKSGSTSVSNPESYFGSTVVTYGDVPTLPQSVPQWSSPEYVFSNWYIDAECTQLFDTSAAYSYPNDITLYAGWTLTPLFTNHTVTYNSDGGTPVTPYVGFNPIGYVPVTTKPGYTFVNWRYSYVDYNNNIVWEAFDFDHMAISSDFYLKAFWQIKNNTVSFDSSGGSAVSPITSDYDTAITKPADPTRSGFTFDGWYTDKALTNEFTAWKMPADSLTLYAKWTAAAGSVTYYVQYYTQILQEIDTTYELYRTDTMSAAEGLTLKLYYTRNRYNLTTNTGLDGDKGFTISVLYGATLSSYLAAPTFDGKVFAGWFESNGTQHTSAETMPASDLSVTGRWDNAEVQYSAKDSTGMAPMFQNSTLEKALAACAEYGGTINLLMNLELPDNTATMVIPANVTLSGNYTYYDETTSTFVTTTSGISVANNGYLPNAFSLSNGSTINQMTLTGCGISVPNGATATLASCTLTGCTGNVITNAGNLTLSVCTITGNTFAASTGSLIASTGTLNVTQSISITGNTAALIIDSSGTLVMGCGGGTTMVIQSNTGIPVYISGGIAYIVDAAISDNKAQADVTAFGGVYATAGTVHLVRSIVINNYLTKTFKEGESIVVTDGIVDLNGTSNATVKTYYCALGTVPTEFTYTDIGSATGKTSTTDALPTASSRTVFNFMNGVLYKFGYCDSNSTEVYIVDNGEPSLDDGKDFTTAK